MPCCLSPRLFATHCLSFGTCLIYKGLMVLQRSPPPSADKKIKKQSRWPRVEVKGRQQEILRCFPVLPPSLSFLLLTLFLSASTETWGIVFAFSVHTMSMWEACKVHVWNRKMNVRQEQCSTAGLETCVLQGLYCVVSSHSVFRVCSYPLSCVKYVRLSEVSSNAMRMFSIRIRRILLTSFGFESLRL